MSISPPRRSSSEDIRLLERQLETESAEPPHQNLPSLSERDQDAMEAVAAKVKEHQLHAAIVSPSRGVLQTPDRSSPSSDDEKTLLVKRRHEERKLARAEKSVKEGKAELEAILKASTAFRAKLQEDVSREIAELARVKKEKEEAEIALASMLKDPQFAAEIKKRTQELTNLTKARTRLIAEVATLKKERDAAIAAESVDAHSKPANGRRVSFATDQSNPK